MNTFQSKDPMHGVTLEMILNQLVEEYGWEKLGQEITIRCFNHDPSIKSSLTFLRKTPWARKKVENYYRWTLKRKSRKRSGTPAAGIQAGEGKP